MIPALRLGYIVLADRYIFTAFARDYSRGCDEAWVSNTYAYAPTPSLALYFQTPLDVAIDRILAGRPELKYHEAGLDLGLTDDPVESFRLFQGMVKDVYDQLAAMGRLTVIDATKPIHLQQSDVRERVGSLLADYTYPADIASAANAPITSQFVDPTRVPESQSPTTSPLRLSKHGTPGKLVVIEGTDYSGHTQQCKLLKGWLEEAGHAVYMAGIKRSKLMGEAIEEAKEEQILGPTTMGLFYATDFADELENGILPALRSGMIVVADRYVYTLMARQLVRGRSLAWLDELYKFAPAPDAAIYLSVPAEDIVRRGMHMYGQLHYWESGMDLAICPDPLDSVVQYQTALLAHYQQLTRRAPFSILDGTLLPLKNHRRIQSIVKKLFS